jgi:xylulokinase
MMIIKGYLLKDVAARLGVPANIPVAAGSGDNMMSALGCGCTQEGRFVISLGTSGTIFTQTSKPPSVKRSSSSSAAPFLDATGYGLPLVCIQNCASVPEEVVKAYGMSRDKV